MEVEKNCKSMKLYYQGVELRSVALGEKYTQQFFDGDDEKGDLTISTILDCQTMHAYHTARTP